MKIWAHRGCSQRYPENTLAAFSRALDIDGLTGIELDIQMTRDGELVVIHDERVDRTTDGVGYVKDFTYSQLRRLHIETGGREKEHVPSIKEVLELMHDRMEEGIYLNIELKNSIIPYDNMEEKVVDLINQCGLGRQVIYSSFYVKSLVTIGKLDSQASLGVLDTKVSDCLYKKKGSLMTGAALHPFWKGMDLVKEQLDGQTIRAWMTGHLYPEKPTGTKLDLLKLEKQGITDVILNEPERYLNDN